MKRIAESGIILGFHEEYVKAQHGIVDNPFAENSDVFLEAVKKNAESNCTLWHLEDDARMIDVSDARIARIKRAIDKNNQERNDRIEIIDELIVSELPALSEEEKQGLPSNSETPGSIIDRLCISALKIFHMKEETLRADASESHKETCRKKLYVLDMQKGDLASAYDLLIDDLFKKKKQLKVYRQFKMYNDPALNPSLYKKKN